MASNEKISRFDFVPWAGVAYVIDSDLRPDEFFRSEFDGMFHIGAGTDIQLRLFWLNLTQNDRRFLKALNIGFE
jgi:hypothetical protein